MDANRTLASPMDGILQNRLREWHRPRREQRLPRPRPAGNTHGYRDGTYIVRTYAFPAVPDGTIGFAGAETFIYRLTVTTGPLVEACVSPRRGAREAGRGRVDRLEHCRRRSQGHGSRRGRGARHGVSREGGEHRDGAPRTAPTILKTVKVDDKEPQTIALPVSVSGKLDTPADARSLPIRREERAKARLSNWKRVRSASRLSGVLRLTDADGKVLARVEETTPRRLGRATPC